MKLPFKTKMIASTVVLILTIWLSQIPNLQPHQYLGLKYTWWIDFLFHSSYYLLSTFLFYLIINKPDKTFMFFFTTLLLTYIIEGLQSFAPGRSVSMVDLSSNFFGVLCGTILGYTVNYKLKSDLNKQEQK